MTTATFGKPETAREALEMWDRGDSVFTVEMGGLGPGYEQVIHIMAFEVIRDLLSREGLDAYWKDADASATDADAKRRASAFADAVETAVMPRISSLGSTGAQWCAARSVAFRTMRVGWAKALDEVPDRLIQVSRAWPTGEPPPAVAASDPHADSTGKLTTRVE